MKWRAEIRVHEGAVQNVYDLTNEPEENWQRQLTIDGSSSRYKPGVYYYVEVEDSELPEVPV